MTRKKTAGTSTVTEGSAQAALRRGGARQLDATEERVMRMRLGAALPPTGLLEWQGTESEEAEIEIRALEIETWMKMKVHRARQAAKRPATTSRTTTSSRTKDKIVRALRRRGPTR
jgi:hypothetical protein